MYVCVCCCYTVSQIFVSRSMTSCLRAISSCTLWACKLSWEQAMWLSCHGNHMLLYVLVNLNFRYRNADISSMESYY